MSKIGINGFGRIGRCFLRIAMEHGCEVVAINDPLITVEHMVYLFKYDSTHGRFLGKIKAEVGILIINGHRIAVFNEQNPQDIIWSCVGAEYIIEVSGIFLTLEKASLHLSNSSGAKKVIIGALSPDAPTLVWGVNHEAYNPNMNIISTGSSLLQCLGPLAKVLNEHYGIVEGIVTSYQSFTALHTPIDGVFPNEWRIGRGANQNLIPSPNFISTYMPKIISSLEGKLDGITIYVPTPAISMIDFVVRLKKPTNIEDIKKNFYLESCGYNNNIFGYIDDQIVSSDFINDSHSSVFDAMNSVLMNEHFMKLIAWYDNEYGYCHRLVDTIIYMQNLDSKL